MIPRLLRLAGDVRLVECRRSARCTTPAATSCRSSGRTSARRAPHRPATAGDQLTPVPPEQRSTAMRPGRLGGELVDTGDHLLLARRRGQHGAVGGEQQAAERRVPAAERGRPPHDRLMAGSGQRNVGEAQLLAALLLDVALPVGREVGTRPRHRRRSSAGRRSPGRGTRAGRLLSIHPSFHRYGQYTIGNSRPLLRWMVSTCTASLSDSSRRLRSSLATSWRASEIRRRSHDARAVTPSPPATASPWSSWPMWRRSVSVRSPSGRAEQARRAGPRCG